MAGAIVRRFIQILISLLIQAAILFVSSGRLDWIMAWVYVGVYACTVLFNALILLPRNPDIIAERGQVKEGTKGWDRLLAGAVSFYGPMLTLIVSGLDLRFAWSLHPAPTLHLAALPVMVMGYGLFSWAMASNKFFAGVVRIQKERGHTVATGGPYRYVRHPGYVGLTAIQAATPFLLGSLWALIPAGLTICLLFVRTALEDRTLQAELEGYKEYVAQVRYRLLPGIW